MYFKYARTENPNVRFSSHTILSVSVAATNDTASCSDVAFSFFYLDNAFRHIGDVLKVRNEEKQMDCYFLALMLITLAVGLVVDDGCFFC